MTSHNVKYEGLEFDVFGEYEQPEEETGFEGGWSTLSIKINDVECYWMLNPFVIERLGIIIVEENY